MNIMLPLQVTNGEIKCTDKTRHAVDAFIELLLTTPCHSCASDPGFGFIFNNLRFEIFNENEGVIYSPDVSDSEYSRLYEKKVSGSSKSINTFATELKSAIEQYEKRLSDITVTMSYLKNMKRIHVSVEGTLTESNEPYKYSTTINIWN